MSCTQVDYEKDIPSIVVVGFLLLAVILFLWYIFRSSSIYESGISELSRITEETNSILEEGRLKVKAAEAKIDAIKYGEDASKKITELSDHIDQLLSVTAATSDYESKINKIKDFVLIKAESLYRRSNLMLLLGLMVAVVGIVVFYFSVAKFEFTTVNEYLISSIRPFFILVFIESISIYLLRQYRVLIKDYNYFFNIYMHKNDSVIINSLIQNENFSDELKTLLIAHLSSFSYSVAESAEIKNIDKSNLSSIIKDIVSSINKK